MVDKANPYGYDLVDDIPMGNNRYLSFRKGDLGKVLQVRLVSEPRYVLQHWIEDADGREKPINCRGEECPYCGKDVPPGEKADKTAKWGWVVIDRDDGQVKVFTGPTLIARKIKEISELVDRKTGKQVWGNPMTYDLQIVRTEEPGASYYKVDPMPEGKGQEITADEKKAVSEAGFNLDEELEGSKKSEHVGNYGQDKSPGKSANVAKLEDVASDDIPF